MAKKYQVFISSTFDDLKEHRDAVVKAVLQLGHLPVGMEMFNAGDQTQWETIKSYIDSSDYYLVVLAHRYGSKDPESDLSYTEKEYDYAGEQGIPRLGFVIDKKADWPVDQVEAKAKKKLDAFKGKVGSARVIKFWDNIDKLAYHVSLSLSNEITINPRIGWVRATEASSPQVAEELARLSKENKELLDKVSQSQPIDEIADLQRIIATQTFDFPVNEQIEPVSLKDIFLATAEMQEDPSPYFIHNHILSNRSNVEINLYTYPEDITAVKTGLDKLMLYGVVKATNDGVGGAWYLTEKGQRLYVRLQSIDFSIEINQFGSNNS
jgi:hypothetical protein